MGLEVKTGQRQEVNDERDSLGDGMLGGIAQ
jgi:hypothetical protein